MKIHVVAGSAGAALLLSLAGGAARAQGIHVLRPAHNAIVRETVQVKVAPNDLPPGGYVAISIDDNFRIAQELPKNPDSPVFIWDTKGTVAQPVKDGNHTITITVFTANSKIVGTDEVPVRVANQIPMSDKEAFKFTYHWAKQPRLAYHRESAMTVPGDQSGGDVTAAVDTSGAAAPPPPDQVLESSLLEFVRTVEGPTATKAVVRDLVAGGTVTNRGQAQAILKTYDVEPRRRTVDARGVILSRELTSDLADHIGFAIPELPARRILIGASWQSPAQIPLNWDGSSAAYVMAECQLVGFEWQNNYPTAKIHETYSGPATFTSQPATADHAAMPPMKASKVLLDRTIYFAYGSGRLIKSVTDTQVTLTLAQLAQLGGSLPVRGISPGGGYPGGEYPGSRYAPNTLGGADDLPTPQYFPTYGQPSPTPQPTSAMLKVTETATLATP